MPLSTRFRFTVLKPEADRGDKSKGGEANAIIRVDMQFPLDCPDCYYHTIGDLSMAEIRLCFIACTADGSADPQYKQIDKWCNLPSERPADGVMEETVQVAWSDARVWLKSYPNTPISNLEIT